MKVVWSFFVKATEEDAIATIIRAVNKSKHGRLPNEGGKKKGEVVTCFYCHSWAHEELHPNIDVEHPCLIDSGVVTDEVIADWLPPEPLDLSRHTSVNTTILYKSTSGLLLRQHVQ
jgi:hypothetical protein